MKRYQLSKAGINVNQAIERLGGDKEEYENLLHEFVADTHYQEMIDAINNKDCKKAFDKAHALKGIAGNLSFTKFYDLLFPIVETLRVGSMSDIEDNLFKLRESYAEIVQAINA